MTLFPPVLADADVRHLPGWLSPAEADALQRALLATVAWEVHRIRMFGRLVDSPRLSSWIGDADARYRYSGTEFVPQPWPPLLGPLRQRLQHEFGARFNSVLANRYRDGRDSMGWHSDDEPELGAEPVIASLSLGSCRRFLLRRRRPRQAPAGTYDEPAIEYRLGHGDLLLMAGSTQRHYQHALPKMAAVAGERINLTFRWVQPSR